MDSTVTEDLSIMWRGRDGGNIDAVLEAFERVEANATKDDLPEITECVQRQDVGFWIRELLMQSVVSLGGASQLPAAFEALRKNDVEQHDSDGLVSHLMDFAEENPKESKLELERILSDPQSPFHKDAEWLMEFCE